MNSARYFIRREDDEPPRTPRESPFRMFDEDAGELRLVLVCTP